MIRAAGAALLSLVILLGAAAPNAGEQEALLPWPEHPSYWQYNGRPVLLLGGSDDDSLFQWPAEMLRSQLDLLRSAGGNYVRNTLSDRRDRGFELSPFAQQDDGRYDLNAWNPEYWARLERFLHMTEERDIVVQIEVWDRFDYSLDPWTTSPYNPANNVNYTASESGLATSYPEHPGRNVHPFFFSTPEQRNDRVILQYQQRFVDRLLSHTLRFDHVLYCIDNETSGEEAWGRYWAEHIKRRARERGRTVQVTEMWDAWDITSPQHRHTLDHPELYDFVDVSQNSHNSGETHWRNALWVRRYLADAPRPINTVKTYGADGNKFGHTDQDGVERFFRHVLAGFAAVRFHRPDSGLGLSTTARAAIRAARQLEALVPPWTLTPRDGVLSNGFGGEVYVAAANGALVLYFPQGGRADIETSPGTYEIAWAGLSASSPPTRAATESDRLSVSAPQDGHWLAVVRRDE